MFYIESLKWNKKENLLWEGLKIFLGANLIAVFSYLKVFLPGNPVPIIFQTTVVLLLAVLMGRKAAYSVLLFLIEGMMGLPVFANGGGALYLLGATGGYLLGFLAAAYIVGLCMESCKEKTLSKAFFAMALGKLIIFAFGVTHLSSFVGWSQAFWLGVVPFLGPDLCKLFFNIAILRQLNWPAK